MRLSGKTLGPSSVGIVELKQYHAGVANPGLVAVLAAPTIVVEQTLFNLTLGSWVMMTYRLALTKGGVAGNTVFAVDKNGGAGDIDWILPSYPTGISASNQIFAHPAGAGAVFQGMMIGRVGLAGDYTLSMVASSAGSNATVNANDALLGAFVIYF